MNNIIKKILIAMTFLSFFSCQLGQLGNINSSDINSDLVSRGTTAEHNQIVVKLNEILHRVVSTTWGDSDVTTYLSDINADGSWSDLDLSDTTDSDGQWDPSVHLTRIYRMAWSYTYSASIHYQDTDIFTAIEAALGKIYDADPSCENWWHDQINEPRALGSILIMMSEGLETLSPTLVSNISNRCVNIYHEPSHLTGGNLVDISLWRFYFGAMMDDSAAVTDASTNTYSTLVLTTAEGVQHDFSYHQHGPQFLPNAYGAVLLSGINKVAEAAAGTSYALSGDKLAIYSGFTRGSYAKPRRGAYMAYNTVGRGVSRPGSTDFDENTFTVAAIIDADNATEYENLNARAAGTMAPDQNIIEGNTHYNRSKYTVHNNTKFNFSVLTANTRLDRLETGNGENLQGLFLSDGSSSIMVDGDEYFDVYPLWDWNKIPGVTAPLYTNVLDLKPAKDWGVLGTSTFTGGVSDGTNGSMVYELNDYNTNAKKSWFFFDDKVVHLGAGISSTSTYNIATTLNQVNLDGDISYSQNASVSQISTMGEHTFTATSGLEWVWHDKVGYFFLDNNDVVLENETRTGNWYDINNRYNESATGDVFSLWIDHGNQPGNDDYAYVIAPGVTNVNDMATYDLSAITVLENSSDVQAVKHSGLDMLQIVFYTAKTVTYGDITISTSAPATIIFNNISTANVTCIVSDPAETSSQIVVDWESAVSSHVRATVDMPTTDAYIGGSVTGTFVEYVPPVANTETFGKLLLDGWGSETYTGDNGITWTVDGKGVTGYVNATKHIYFQGKDTVAVVDRVKAVESGIISGGIGSFSVEVKDLWDAGNERKLELLVNGNVVGTSAHTGTEVYTFTVDNINISGDFTIAIRNVSTGIGNNTIAIDNITWQPYTAVSQTETFANLLLDGWGSETYTGDNNITWTVDGKGVTGYVNATKHIYFQGKDTVAVVDRVKAVESGIISGGIGSFSVEVKDLWDAGNERKLELLVNGNVVGTSAHTGTEVYTFTVDNINISGDFTIAIRNVSTGIGNNTIAIDNMSWTSY